MQRPWEKVTMATSKEHILSGRIVCPAVLCHGPSQDNDLTACNMLCSGPGKRKLSGRKGRWWPRSTSPSTSRRPWRSTVLARKRFQKYRQEAQDNVSNDKFTKEQLHWAKEGLVAGIADSRMKVVASSNMRESISSVDSNIPITTDVEKPGGNAGAAKDIPGKQLQNHLSNIFLPGHDSDRRDAEGCEVQHQEAGAVSGDQDQVLGGEVEHLQHDV